MRYGNPVIDCAGAQVRAQCRQLATVVTVNGDIDADNVDRVIHHVRRFVLLEKPFVLDLSGVESFSPDAVSLLDAVDDDCEAADVEWTMVASRPVSRRLRTDEIEFPSVPSVADALNHFADNLVARRRLLPLLTKTA